MPGRFHVLPCWSADTALALSLLALLYAHLQLVRLLLPYIRKAEQPRIVFVSSKAATWGNVSLDNLNAEKIAPSGWTGLARFKT